MTTFFINRPIVAMVIAILTVLVGVASMLNLPVSQYPEIVPPQIVVQASYIGADALTVEQSVATPIEQQMSGVDNMEYMMSTNANNGSMSLTVTFDVASAPDTDQILTQMRTSQAESQIPQSVRDFGLTVNKSLSSPLVLFALTSSDEALDSLFLTNYAVINLNDRFTLLPGVASVTVFGAGEYAMRLWINPDILASKNITVSEIASAIQTQNNVNPAGQTGSEPLPPGQEFTYSVRAQGRLTSPEEFANIIVRENADGSIVRVKDIARVELGAQIYSLKGRFDSQPSAILALYQTPGSNALEAAGSAKALMAEMAKDFPEGMKYEIALDTTLAVTEGIKEIEKTLIEALILVVLVVFVFLQGWRATLIPLIAVPVSLIGTFIIFPFLGFSINTLSLFGLVLAIGLVVDDAIVVVEAVQRHIENGLSPRDATLQAMKDVTGPIMATSLVLIAVFVPTVFIPGITGRLYQQFAITIALSVLLSAFNALSLSPALSALLLRERKPSRGPLGWFFGKFNRLFDKSTNVYVGACRGLIRKSVIALLFLALAVGVAWFSESTLPPGFIPDEDQGYAFAAAVLPPASSLQRTDELAREIENLVSAVPGVAHVTSIIGFNLLSGVQNTYSAFFFVTLKPWEERYKLKNIHEQNISAVFRELNVALFNLPQAEAFSFPPPPIPGIGTAGGVTFMLLDRGGHGVAYLADNTQTFVEAVKQRPEIMRVMTTFTDDVPMVFVDVDRDKALKQGVDLSSLYQTIQAFMGGAFVDYFNRFGRQWQVYIQAEGDYRTQAKNLARFYVRNNQNDAVPLGSLINIQRISGPEFTQRFNLQRTAQINVTGVPGYSSAQIMDVLEEVFQETMPSGMGFSYSGMSYEERKAAKSVSPTTIFALSLVFVFLILAALYESWSLPFSVLLSLPIAVAGAFGALALRSFGNNVYSQIGLVMLIGLAAKNAILIVEFARQEREDHGKSIKDAALEGARLRLRPILMTSFAFILGCVPLWTALGSGMVSRRILGTTVIGGMLAASMFAIFVIPTGFYLVEKLTARKQKSE